jgi:hypothetical protein
MRRDDILFNAHHDAQSSRLVSICKSMLAATEILQIREKLIKEMDVNRYEIVI